MPGSPALQTEQPVSARKQGQNRRTGSDAIDYGCGQCTVLTSAKYVVPREDEGGDESGEQENANRSKEVEAGKFDLIGG